MFYGNINQIVSNYHQRRELLKNNSVGGDLENPENGKESIESNKPAVSNITIPQDLLNIRTEAQKSTGTIKNINQGQKSSQTYTKNHNQHSIDQAKGSSLQKKTTGLLFEMELVDRSNQVQPRIHQAADKAMTYRRNLSTSSGTNKSAVPHTIMTAHVKKKKQEPPKIDSWHSNLSKRKLNQGLEHLANQSKIKQVKIKQGI